MPNPIGLSQLRILLTIDPALRVAIGGAAPHVSRQFVDLAGELVQTGFGRPRGSNEFMDLLLIPTQHLHSRFYPGSDGGDLPVVLRQVLYLGYLVPAA